MRPPPTSTCLARTVSSIDAAKAAEDPPAMGAVQEARKRLVIRHVKRRLRTATFPVEQVSSSVRNANYTWGRQDRYETRRGPLYQAFRAPNRSDQAKGFVVLPRRWVVERTIAWL